MSFGTSIISIPQRTKSLTTLEREGSTTGMIGFDIACESIEKRAENAESSRKSPLQTLGANTKRTDFALAA